MKCTNHREILNSMLSTNDYSIGKFVIFANRQKVILQDDLGLCVENLVDLITIKIKHDPIELVAQKLLPEIFDLRIKLLKWIGENEKILQNFITTINGEIAKNIQFAPYSDLSAAMAEYLTIVEKINTPIFHTISNKKVKEEIISNINYDVFKIALSLASMPSTIIHYNQKIMETSLQWEFAWILSNLVLTNQINLEKNRIERELIPFLKKTITRYGAYAILLNIWQPSDFDSPLVNRIEILAASIRMDNKIYNRTSLEELKELVNT